jgi:esterase/lipase
MKKIVFIFIIVSNFFGVQIKAQNNKPIVYLIPGQGADSRLFKNLKIDNRFDVENIEYFTPEKSWDMKDFAQALSSKIDTNRTYYIIGVSLGGMLATEMGDFLNPEKIIVVSSAKSYNEFPGRYLFQKKLPVYKIVPAGIVKFGAQVLQPLVEPDRKYDRETFAAMLKAKSKKFLKRTSTMILEWDRVTYRDDIIHIHGNNDHTIPIKNVNYDYLIKDGSHMMILTKGDEMSKLINRILLDLK